MSDLLRFAAFDAHAFIDNRRQVLVAVAFPAVIAAVSPVPIIAAPAASMLAALSASYPFGNDERGRLDQLYGALPISRRTVVLGRYATMIGLVMALTILGCGVGVVVAAVRRASTHADLLAPLALGGVVVALVLVSLQLPLFFVLGFARARPLVPVISAVVIGATFVISRLSGSAAGVVTAASEHAFATVAGSAIVCGVLLTASAALSTRAYQRRRL